MKKLLAAILTIVMILTAVPISAFATNAGDRTGEMQNEAYAEGTTTVGNFLADTLQEAQAKAEEDSEAVAGIKALEVYDFFANVEYFTEQDAKLFVAIYTEDGKKMLTSGMTEITAEENYADVDITPVTLPQYYLVKGFILDSITNSALCSAFTDDTHTQAYIEFMAMDIHDFDQDNVINLDNNEDTNFMVVDSSITKINGTETANILTSADYDTMTFVFDNIDDSLKALKNGDSFYFNGANGENEVIKISNIKISGTTATITGSEDIDIEEAFEYVRIDSSAIKEEESELAKAPRAKSQELGTEKTFFKFNFGLELVKKEKDGKVVPVLKRGLLKGNYSKDETLSEKKVDGDKFFTAEFDFTLKTSFSIDLSKKYKKVEFKVTGSSGITVTLEKDFVDKEIPLGGCFATFLGVVNVGSRIKFHFTITGKITASGTLTFSVGFKWSEGKGFDKVFEKPKFKPEVKGEVVIHIGLIFETYLNMISEYVLEISLPKEIALEIGASMSTDVLSSEHECNLCIAGDIKVIFTASTKLKILSKTHFGKTYSHKILDKITFKITDFYYSITHNDFGWGTCPYIKEDDPNSANYEWTGNEQVGDIITFGSYPQSKVTKQSTIDALNKINLAWKSYGYYSGNGDDGLMVQGDYMKYADVVFNNNKYRAVKFTQYRPYRTNHTPNYTYQDDNGYYTNTVYWFKYEPLKWRVLDPSNGLVLSEICIDSQAYSNTIYSYNGYYYNDEAHTNYASDYKTSSIREWLNNDFYNTAFNSTQQGKIVKTKLDNSSPYNNNQYGSESTTDKVFLMSYNEMLNSSYGFSTSYSTNDVARRAKSTDYAKAQGCWQNTSSSYQGNAHWFLRSPGSYSNYACYVFSDGYVDSYYDVDHASLGVRPALRLNLTSKISTSSVESENFAVDEPQEAVAPKKAITRAAVAAGTIFDFSYSACTSGSNYVLLNVTNYSEIFELTNNNLQYIDILTADENGKVTADFEPKTKSANSTTLLIGDFGNGIEARVMTEDTVDKDAQLIGVTFEIKNVDTNYNRTLVPVIDIDVIGNPEYSVEYASSDPNVAVVDQDGNIKTVGKGTATITVTVTDADGNVVTDTCNVNVKFTFWQWLLYIICFGWIWM